MELFSLFSLYLFFLFHYQGHNFTVSSKVVALYLPLVCSSSALFHELDIDGYRFPICAVSPHEGLLMSS